ncbi:MAG: gliding motility-associated C-terminal domain-containing protein, partial [Bacteroidetes bacterium]|nr:gliding motility-associated C-terminal domain-containing protein [Bacteroidota bacterium]
LNYIVTTAANAGPDQSICTDNTTMGGNAPLVGETATWTVVSGTGVFSDALDPATAVSSLTAGLNEFEWEIKDAGGTCTISDIVKLNYIITTAANAGPNQSICTDNTTLAGNAPLVGEIGQWSVVTGTGTFASLNDPLSTVTGLTPGLNEFNWGITDGTGTCMANDLVQINYITVTTADAGADQSICSDNTVMAGNSLQVGETGTWSLVAGSALLTDVNDPLSTISNITTNTVDLQWTITDGLGLCTSSDVVTISANLPITAAGTSQTVSIGETAVIDVQSLATINGGDILTTIITTAPTKGTATVLSDGTIEYTPNSGVFGADIIDFQLCNQCGNCDNASISIDIPNDPPTITSEPVIVAPGTLSVSLDLSTLVGDINNNADLSTLQITTQPISGAVASIDANFNLIIDYTGITFSGTDEVSIEVCDTQGECTVSVLFFVVNVSAEETPPITVYNVVSPNGDGKHDFLKIINIEFYTGNEVFIYDKIGNLVFRMLGYNNLDNIFEGIATEGNERELANGTYYYFIQLNSDQSESGFLLLQK